MCLIEVPFVVLRVCYSGVRMSISIREQWEDWEESFLSQYASKSKYSEEKEVLTDKGYKKIYLETHTNLKAAIHLYEKCGYKLIEKPKEVVHSSMNRFYLKELL